MVRFIRAAVEATRAKNPPKNEKKKKKEKCEKLIFLCQSNRLKVYKKVSLQCIIGITSIKRKSKNNFLQSLKCVFSIRNDLTTLLNNSSTLPSYITIVTLSFPIRDCKALKLTIRDTINEITIKWSNNSAPMETVFRLSITLYSLKILSIKIHRRFIYPTQNIICNVTLSFLLSTSYHSEISSCRTSKNPIAILSICISLSIRSLFISLLLLFLLRRFKKYLLDFSPSLYHFVFA